MEKKLLTFIFLALFSVCAWAQDGMLSDAVTFKKEAKEEVKEVQEKPAFDLNNKTEKKDAKVQLAESTKNVSILDNPRFAKMGYARLKGMQKSIEKVQQKKIDKTVYTNESEKEKALKELENQALVQFDDYQDKPADLQKKINENPRESMFDMTSRLSYYGDRNEPSEEQSAAIQKKLEKDFQDDNGISMEEYEKAFEEQLMLEQQLSKEEKSETFPVLKNDKEVEIEKVDEQNALIHVSVGAPRSKKE